MPMQSEAAAALASASPAVAAHDAAPAALPSVSDVAMPPPVVSTATAAPAAAMPAAAIVPVATVPAATVSAVATPAVPPPLAVSQLPPSVDATQPGPSPATAASPDARAVPRAGVAGPHVVPAAPMGVAVSAPASLAVQWDWDAKVRGPAALTSQAAPPPPVPREALVPSIDLTPGPRPPPLAVRRPRGLTWQKPFRFADYDAAPSADVVKRKADPEVDPSMVSGRTVCGVPVVCLGVCCPW